MDMTTYIRVAAGEHNVTELDTTGWMQKGAKCEIKTATGNNT